MTKRDFVDCELDTGPLNGYLGIGTVRPEDQLPNVVTGRFFFDEMHFGLYLPESQQCKMISGHELRRELVDKPVLNANVLDYLLDHPYLIPEKWKEGSLRTRPRIFFWGSIYHLDGNPPWHSDLGVRCLVHVDTGWDWYYRELGESWDHIRPTCILTT